MFALFHPRAARSALVALLCVSMVAACTTGGGSGGADDQSLTPEQRRLRAQTADYNNTIVGGVAAGALLGTVVGALIGAAAGNRNTGAIVAGAAIGAAAGGALGGVAGQYVANKKRQYANENNRLDAMAADVRSENQRLEQLIATSRAVVAQDRADLERLRGEVVNRRVARSDLDRRVATAEQDAAQIQQAIGRLHERRNQYVAGRNDTLRENRGANSGAMDAEIHRLDGQIAQLEGQLNELNTVIGITKTG